MQKICHFHLFVINNYMHRQMPYIIIAITKQQQSLTQKVITLRYSIFSNKLVLYLIRPQNIYSLEIDGGGGGNLSVKIRIGYRPPFTLQLKIPHFYSNRTSSAGIEIELSLRANIIVKKTNIFG